MAYALSAGSAGITCPLLQVARKIDGVIRRFYRPGAMRAHIVEDSDNPQYWQDGESARDIIQEIAGVEVEVADAVDAALSAAESRDVWDGDDAYYGGDPLEHIDVYAGEFMNTWFLFEQRLKHEVRFFDDDGKRLLDDLFGDLPSLASGQAIVTINPGDEFSTLFRARVITSDPRLPLRAELCTSRP